MPSRLAPLGGLFRRNQDLLRNASSLAATTGLTSLLGFAFWIYAARVFSGNAVGYGSAAISTMMLLGMLGLFGLDTMLIGELPHTENRGGLIAAACIFAGIGSFVLGLGWALISVAFSARFTELNGTVGRMLIFSLGVGVTGATLVFDNATIGLMRGGLQLSRNTAVSVAKMAALPAAALVLHDAFGVGIMLAWVAGTVISLIPVAIMIKRSGGRILHRPDWQTLWQLRKVAMAHNWLNLAVSVPPKLMPVLVAMVVSPSANGAYYIATMISSFLFMVPQSLSTVLYAVASAAPDKIAEKLRFVLRMSLAIGVPSGLVMALGAHFFLSVFKPSDAALATVPLWIMIAGYLPGLPNHLYITVARVKGRFNQAAVLLIAFGALRMIVLVLGGKMDGLFGVASAVFVVAIVQAMITAPSVLRAAYGTVTVSPEATQGQWLRPVEGTVQARLRHTEQMRLQQEAGIAMLVALATRTTGPISGTRIGAGDPESRTKLAFTRPEPRLDAHRRSRRLSVLSATRANPTISGTNRKADLNEVTFHSQQEAGMAALIEIATQAAKF